MAPRKAFIVGMLILAGFGALFIGCFGVEIYHWYLTGDLWIMSRSGLGQYTTYAKTPNAFVIQFGVYALLVGMGVVCLAAALINPVRYRKQLLRRD